MVALHVIGCSSKCVSSNTDSIRTNGQAWAPSAAGGFDMQKYRDIAWVRIIAEGTAIVVSILLAFAIDAWWQRQSELDQAEALISSLHADFTSSQSHIEEWLVGNEKILSTLTEFRDELAATTVNDELIVPIEWVVAAIGAPTYSPTDATLETAISSGQIELIEDVELRTRLAKWRQQLDDTQEDELLVREIVVHHLVPALSQQIRLSRAFEFDMMVGWFLDQSMPDANDELSLQASTILEGALAERMFYTTFVVGGLTDIRETQTEILRLLEKNMRR